MEKKICIWVVNREIFKNQHDYFMELVQSRIFDNFDDMEKEEEEIELFPPNDCERELYLMDRRERIDELRRQIVFTILASIYHKWEKDIRVCLKHELEKEIKQGNFVENLCEELKQAGWDIEGEPWYKMIDACRLIVNVHKHGDGISKEVLNERYPQFVKKKEQEFSEVLPQPKFDKPVLLIKTDELVLQDDYLSIAPEQFDEIADAFKQFWANFPVRRGQEFEKWFGSLSWYQ